MPIMMLRNYRVPTAAATTVSSLFVVLLRGLQYPLTRDVPGALSSGHRCDELRNALPIPPCKGATLLFFSASICDFVRQPK